MSLYEKMNSTFKEAMSRYKEDNNVLLPESTYIMKLKEVKTITGKTSGKTNMLIERVVVENEEDSNDTEVVGLICKQWINTEVDFSLQSAIKLFVIHFDKEPENAEELCVGLEELSNTNPMERVLVTHYTNKTTGVIGANYDVIESLVVCEEGEVPIPMKEQVEEVPIPMKEQVEEAPASVKKRRKRRKKKVEEVEEVDTDMEKLHKVISFFGDILKDDESLTGWETMTKKELVSILELYDMEEDKDEFKTIFNDSKGYEIWIDLLERNK